MNLTDDALRWLAYQATMCRDKDCAEAICLVAPALLQYVHLPAMTDEEAKQFGAAVKAALATDLRKAA